MTQRTYAAGNLPAHVPTGQNPDGTFSPINTRSLLTATIASGESVTAAIDLGNTSLVGFVAPAAWTTAALNIGVSVDGTNWATAALDSFGSAVSSWSSVTAGAAYSVDPAAMLPWRYIRFRSGTQASPVNQSAARTFTVITRPLA